MLKLKSIAMPRLCLNVFQLNTRPPLSGFSCGSSHEWNASIDSETIGFLYTRLFYKPMRNAPCKIFSRINRNCLLIVHYCCVVSVLQFTPYHAGLSLYWAWTLMVWQQLMSHVISHGIDFMIIKALFSFQMALYLYLGRPNSCRLIHIVHVSMGCMADE